MPGINLLSISAALLTLLSACGTMPSPVPWPLEGTYWQLVAVRGQFAPALVTARQPRIFLQAAGRRFAAHSGCALLVGSYELEGNALRFGKAAGGRMDCGAGMESDTDAAFLTSLREVEGWRMAGDRLQLLGENQAVVAEFASGSQRYACEDGKALLVHYDQVDPQRPSAWLVLDGRGYRMRLAPAASGSRYVGQPGREPNSALEWWTRGTTGLLREGPSGGLQDSAGWQTVASCVRR